MAETSNTFSSSSILRYTGRVKWFNIKNGYGFITPVLTHGEDISEDIFVHHTSILVGTEQYRYLTEGEYVDFNLERAEYNESKTPDRNFKFHAVNVTGVARGFLMCETKFAQVLAEQRRKSRPRLSLEKTNYIHEDKYSPKTPRGRRTSSETPRGDYNESSRRRDNDSDDECTPLEEEFTFPKQKRVASRTSSQPLRQNSRA